MNSIVQLASGSSRCERAARRGASIAGLWRHGVPVLCTAPAPIVADVRHCDCDLLAPFALRGTSRLQRLVLHTHPHLDGISTAPVCRVNNALTMAQGDTRRLADLGVYLLQPGESFGANMRIESGPTP